jgi:hypothetical protein
MTCRSRRYRDAETVLRVLWAMRINGRLRGPCRPRFCDTCHAWHIERE